MLKIHSLLLFILILCGGVYAQEVSNPGYKIHFQLDNKSDSIYFLANYYTDKFFIVDTTALNKGIIIFQGQDSLAQGIYILANQKKEKLLEFLVGQDQYFSIHLDQELNPAKAEISGSEENKLFFDHLVKINDSYTILNHYKPILEKLADDSEERIKITAMIDSVNQSLIDFRKSIVQTQPDMLFSKILLAMQEPEIPANLKLEQEAQFRFYKSNFWNTFDLSDERLLYTPLLPRKLETYFTQMVLPVADTVILEIDKIMTLTKGNQKMIDYLAWHFIAEYQTPKIMGLDKAFVYLADEYVAKNKLSNITPSMLEKIMERANKMRLSLIGEKALELWLIDTTGTFRSFRELDSEFTVLIFWDQTCSHCKKEMETLNDLMNENIHDIGVYAINSTNDFEGWKHYLLEKNYPWIHVNGTKSITADFHDLYDVYSVPVIYLLDKSKTIIGKRINAAQIKTLIENYSK